MEHPELLLEVKGLKTYFYLDEGTVRAVEGVDFSLPRGGTLGIVGESGCGKTVTAYSITQLVQSPGRIVDGQVLFHRRSGSGEVVDLAKLRPSGREMCAIRGGEIAMVFQEPMTAFSPVHTIGDQIMEVILLHRKVDKHEARAQAVEMLRRVGIPRAETRQDLYPFQLSGGMRQRAMIAMALVCRPSLLIADEPTTALDVTMQAQILELMQELQRELGMAVILITHNLGVVAEVCDQVAVMYLGQVVEQSGVDALFSDPLHPYTQALLRSIPKLGQGREQRLDPIRGTVPDPYSRPGGCPFHPRCDKMIPGLCETQRPLLTVQPDGRAVACWLYESEPAPATEGSHAGH
jgi:oligopeptide/dipeptide ABC transporter ATP-binding protein